MSETRTVTLLGSKATAQLPGELFDTQSNIPLIHQVVVAQLAAARQGTHSTKTRSEVSGGGAKPWRQKGTGRARQGSRRAPQWTGGGIVHGPKPRNYSQRTPKKMIVAALRGALSDRARDGRIHVIDSLVKGETPSTKAALQSLAQIEGARLLIVLSRTEEVAWLSLRNVISIHVITVDQLNAYDVLVSDDVVFSNAALSEFTGNPLVEVEAEEAPKAKSTRKPAAKKAEEAEKAEETVKKPAAKKPAAKKPAKAEEAEVADVAEAAEVTAESEETK